MTGRNHLRRWEEIEQIFHQVIQAAQAQRAGLVKQLTRGDQHLVQEVWSLVEAAEQSDSFLEDQQDVEVSLISDIIRRWNPKSREPTTTGSISHPITTADPSTAAELVHPTLKSTQSELRSEFEWIKQQLDQLRPELQVLELVGSGGAGIVLRAIDRRLQRDVAIKVLHRNWASQFDSDFLQREAQAGALSHDHIVRVYEVAPAESELPYLVMEWVQGPSLREYLTRRGALSPRHAAELMRQVALGLSAAHAKNLIHGDIKPANILLEPIGQAISDSRAKEHQLQYRARLADFGLARPLTQSLASNHDQPDNVRFIGTPAYASPEQLLDGRQGDVASDIWSIGATLYHALVGTPPFAGRPDAIMRQMRIGDPRPLRRIDPRINRDLESICLKALAREPSRRYPTAQAVADDLLRYLNGQPVAARPVSLPNRWVKSLKRHPLVSALVVLLCSTLLSGMVASNYFRLQAEANLDLAQENLAQAANQRDRARTVIQLLQGMITSADPNYGDREVTMRDALAGLERRILGDLSEQPDIEAELRSALGNMYFSLADYERSRDHLQRAVQLRTQPEDLAARLKDQAALANTLRWLYQPEEALALCKSTLEQAEKNFNPLDLTALNTREILAGCLQDLKRHDQAENEYRQVIRLASSQFEPTHPLVLSARAGLASTFVDAGLYAQAEVELRKVLKLRKAADVAGTRDELIIQSNLALTLAELGRLSEAIELQRQILTDSTRLLGPLHDSTLVAKMNLAESLRRSGDQQSALELHQEMLQACSAQFGWKHPNTLAALEGVVLNMIRMDQHAAALDVLERAQSELENQLDSDDDWLYRTRSMKAAALSGLGHHVEALALYTGVIEHFEGKYGPLTVVTLTTKNNFGLALIHADKASEAVTLYSDMLALIDQRFDSMRPVLMRNQGHARWKAGQTESARQQLHAAHALSLERGELENARRCDDLLKQIDASVTSDHEVTDNTTRK